MINTMKYIIRFFIVYIVVVLTVFSFYSEIVDSYKAELVLTKKRIVGVSYLEQVYAFTNSLIEYKRAIENKLNSNHISTLQKKLIIDIDSINYIREEEFDIQNDELSVILDKLKYSELNDVEYYELLDTLNQENYKIGDIAALLYEPDRKLYFLNSLTTHYLPEYLISIAITNSNIGNSKRDLYIEQNKLVILSTQEIEAIVTSLIDYEDTRVLKSVLVQTIIELNNLREHENLLSFLDRDNEELQEHIENSNNLLDLAHLLNEKTMEISKMSYLHRQVDLESKILFDNFVLLFIIFLITVIFIYFEVVFSSNKKKENELLKLNEILDKLVIYSKTDRNGIITYASEAIEKISGYSKEELIGHSHNILRHEDMQAALFENLWATILKNKIWTGEVKNRAKDGSSYWVDTTVIPELNDSGDIIGYISYRVDITHSKEMEFQKQKTQDALEFRSKFLSNMSHEIRTPLNGIIGLTYVALKNELNKKQTEILQKIESSSTHLLGVINDILDISKIEAGKMLIENRDFNIRKVAQNVHDILMVKADEKHIYFDVEYKNIDNYNFKGDSLRISQILSNLASNAIKFTQEGGVSILIEQLDTNKLTFIVKDTGIGLKEESMKSLFEEFTQADMGTSREYGGTGLGLSISKHLVNLMKGSIWVESEYGKGSSFIFELPLENVLHSSTSEEDEALVLQELEMSVNALKGKRILIAEDNKMNQNVLSLILEDTQLELDFSNDGAIALEMYKNNRNYDMILMDIQMPNMNGYEATMAIREFDKNVPIIALTANIMKEDIDKAYDAGVDSYLAKPLDIAKLQSTILKYTS